MNVPSRTSLRTIVQCCGISLTDAQLVVRGTVPGLTEEERNNRALLVGAMQAHGFKNYPMEWWHFTLEPEPYPDTIFDFPIEPRHPSP